MAPTGRYAHWHHRNDDLWRHGVDTLRGGGGADTLDGEEGSDTYDYGATSEAIAGETITDSGTTGTRHDQTTRRRHFSALTTISGIEAFIFTGDQDFQINSFPIFGQDFAITGSNGTAQSFTIHNANEFDHFWLDLQELGERRHRNYERLRRWRDHGWFVPARLYQRSERTRTL